MIQAMILDHLKKLKERFKIEDSHHRVWSGQVGSSKVTSGCTQVESGAREQ